MNVWILEFGLALIMFAGLLPLAVIPLLSKVYRKYGHLPFLPLVLAIGTGLYACGLVAFTLFPLPDVGPGFCEDRAIYEYWQPVPLTSIGEAVQVVLADPVGGLKSSVFLQVAFNVLLFIPLGFLLAFWARRRLWVAAVSGFGLSLLIEVTQGTALFGVYPCPYRTAEVDDIILNTTGAVVGWLIGAGVSKIWPYRDAERTADVDPPSRFRRGLSVGADALGFMGATITAQLTLGLVLTGPLGLSRETDSEVLGFVPFVVIVVFFVVVPMLRADRATPGQAAVLISPRLVGKSPGPDDPPDEQPSGTKPAGSGAGAVAGSQSQVAFWRILVRAVVRFSWLLIRPEVFFLILLVDLVFSAVRKDRRTLVDLVSGTELRGRDERDERDVPGEEITPRED